MITNKFWRIMVAMVISLASVAFFSSCKDENVDPASSEKQMILFAFYAPQAAGVIPTESTNNSITVGVPTGTNVTALVPTIVVSPGATVSPASEVAQDFTNPVTYTVTAPDGSTQQYVVTVVVGGTVVPPSGGNSGGEAGTGTGIEGDPIMFAPTGGSFTNSITEEQQAVWYSFTANGRYDLTVGDQSYTLNNLTSPPYTADVVVSVLDANLNYVEDIKHRQMNRIDLGSNGDSPVTFTDLSGVYYVKIEPYSNGGKGSFYVNLALTGPITAGGSQATAIDITSYKPVAFESEITSSRTERWFKFTANGRYDITVGDRSYTLHNSMDKRYTVDAVVTVLDANLNYVKDIDFREMNRVDIGGNNDSPVTFTDLSGVYYIKIDPYSSNGVGSFYIDIENKGAITAGAGQDDAIALTVGAARVKNEVTSSRPARWFKFTAPATGNASVTMYDQSYNPTGLNETKPDVDAVVTVLDANLSYVADASKRVMNRVDIGGNNDSPVMFQNLTPGAVYYIKIDPYSAERSGFFYVGVN
jgi:hypothetical protein